MTAAAILCAVEPLEVQPEWWLEKRLHQSRPEMRIDDLLGLRNDVLFAAFLKVCRAVEQWTDRPPRIDRSSPAFTHRTNLQAIALIVYNIRQWLALSAVPKNCKALITCDTGAVSARTNGKQARVLLRRPARWFRTITTCQLPHRATLVHSDIPDTRGPFLVVKRNRARYHIGVRVLVMSSRPPASAAVASH